MQLSRPQWTQILPDRVIQLLLLAVTMLTYSVLSVAIGNSLFVSYVGAPQLPIAFILIGLFSMPAYGIFSQIVDRYSRPRLFRYVLIGSIFAVLGLRFLLLQESVYSYYLLLIVVFFQWDFHNNVLYPSLLMDYFTTLEYKRYAPYISVAQAVGIFAGGGLTALLSQFLRTRDLLLVLPVVFAVGIAQLVVLESSQRQLTPVKPTSSVGIAESLKAFPGLVQRYPLALFLAGSSFLLVMIYLSSEFLWFNIYGQSFSDQQLTQFLGLMRVLISVIQIGVIYAVTRPLLKSLGVAQMNPVYPLTTLISLGALLSNIGLPTAIALHINGDALYKGINLPVHQLNYNAIPREFVGRIRTLSDGVIYAVGLMLAGTVLWFCESRLSLVQITWLVAGLTVLLLLVRLPMGRHYAAGLEEMIRSNSIILDEFDTYPIPLSPQSKEAVRELLQESDRYSQVKGLDLALRMSQPEDFLAEVEALVPDADGQLYEKAIALFSHCPALIEHWQARLADESLQSFALELLLIHQFLPSPAEIAGWLACDRQELQMLGAIAQKIANPDADPAWPQTLEPGPAKILTRVVTYGDTPHLKPLIAEVLLSQTRPEVICAGLEALLTLTQRGDETAAGIAQ
ncbi:MAG: cyclic nucleotide-binding domain-containing protein, partial [Cyanobacteria bacterium P01_C01_bin.73]